VTLERNYRAPSHAPSAEVGVPAAEPSSYSNVVAFDFTRSPGRAEKFSRSKGAEPGFEIAPPSDNRTSPSRKLLIAAIILSVACHGGLIASMLMRDTGEEFGTLADKTDTFSLSMEQSVVLESISTESVQMAAAAAAAPQAGSVQSVESKPQELADFEKTPVADEPPPKPIDVADVTPTAVAKTDDPLPIIRGGGTEQAVSEIKADQIAETEVKEMPEAVETKEDAPEKVERKKEIEKEKKTPQQESHQQVAGSSLSRSDTPQTTLNGRASASRGNALTYGAQVRAKLLHNKPMNNALHGSVLVSFAIAADGGLRYLRLSESSGNGALDNVALTMVQKAVPFEEPPSDLTAAQLSYAITINFRN
jgi:periplasmic protein TonB